ncbi:MAG: pyruvate formate lyase family protein [Desulfobacterales bacterium]
MMNSGIFSLLQHYREKKPQLCTQRALIAMDAHKRYASEPGVIRAARMLEAVLDCMSVWILDDERLLGHWASFFRGIPLWPEFGATPDQMGFHVNPALMPVITDQARQEIESLMAYWNGKNCTDRLCAHLPANVKAGREASLWYWHMGVAGNRRGRYLIDLPTILAKGFSGIKQDAEVKLESIDLESTDAVYKQFFYKAIAIVCDAVADFSLRYARLARETSRHAEHRRKEELEEIARICEHVPSNPARSFYEALQASWFAFLVGSIESGGDSISMGGLDAILYPYYKTDRDQGVITREKAVELLAHFLFKFGENSSPISDLDSHVNGITIGRQTEHGQDATNEMTYMLLDALELVRIPKPQFGLRINKKTPDHLLKRAIDVMRVSGGRPQLNSDDAVIPALLRRGIPLKEARDYSIDGCQHFTTYARKDHSAWVNLVKMLDLALNDGVDRLTGKRIGLSTGDPRTFRDVDHVMDAFKKQIAYGITMLNTESEFTDAVLRNETCLPYASINVRGCMEKGLDVLAGGGRDNWIGMHAVGLGTAADSLAAIKKVIFDEKSSSISDLLNALDRNFEGYAGLRQKLHDAPKWGNDDDYVDDLALEVADFWLDEADKHRCRILPDRPGPSIPGFHSLTFALNFGEATAATADGRRAHEPLSDGIAPAKSAFHGGPTDVFRSAAKLDHARSWTGSLTLTIDGETEMLANLFKTYLVSMGGTHLMCNLLSQEMLMDARKNPEKYPDLLVRVAGFSARFVELPQDMQDLVIGRAALNL